MIKNVYSIKDTLVGYGNPFVSYNDATAQRELAAAVNSPKGTTMIAERPEDYQLYKLGTYNDQTGEFISQVEFIQNAPRRKEDC